MLCQPIESLKTTASFFSQASMCISIYMQTTFSFSLTLLPLLSQGQGFSSSVPCPIIYQISGTPCGADDLHCLDLCACVLGQRFSIVSAVTTKGAFNWSPVYPQWKVAITSIRTGSCFLFQIPLLKSHDAPSLTSACPSTIQNQPTCHLSY